MLNRKILHIIPYEKFTYDYINQISRCFNLEFHKFVIYGVKPHIAVKECDNLTADITLFSDNSCLTAIKVIRLFKQYDKIIFHSLFIPPKWLVVFSLLSAPYSKKMFWNIWGADLYDTYWTKDKCFSHKFRELFRKLIIRRFYGVGYIKSDYRALKKWYHVNPDFYLASYSYDFFDIENGENANHNTTNFLVGNSATESCRHIEAFDLINNLHLKDIKVFCVLSYPNNSVYIDEVVSYGKQLFGDSFVPMIDYMPYSEYMKVLDSIDVAIFNNNRQQALGNIASLIYYGKNVYISPENGCLEYFLDIGCHVYSIEELCNYASLGGLNEREKTENKNNIKYFFSDEEFRIRWQKVFDE